MTLLRWLIFLLRSQTDFHSPYSCSFVSISSDAIICSTVAFPPLGNFDHVVVSVSIDFPSNSQWDGRFHCMHNFWLFSCWLGWSSWSLRNFPLEDIFKLGASAAASEFCEWVQGGIDVYIPHRKWQVKPQLSLCFSGACAAAIVHRNHFFRFYQKEKSSDSKVKFRQASNCCKRVLEAAKLAYVNKTVHYLTETWLSGLLGNC